MLRENCICEITVQTPQHVPEHLPLAWGPLRTIPSPDLSRLDPLPHWKAGVAFLRVLPSCSSDPKAMPFSWNISLLFGGAEEGLTP